MNAGKPALSVIVPVRNEGERLSTFLGRVRDVLEPGDELIVVDGQSTDDSQAQAEPQVDQLLVCPRGRARQMNRGAQQARGDWLWFLHADTVIDSRHRQCLQALSADVRWGRFDVRLSGRRPLFRLIAWLMNRRSRLTGIATGDQGIFVRADLFQRVGGYPDQPLMEDIALSRRLKPHGRPRCLRPPLITSSRRWEEKGAWRTIGLMWSLRFRYWRGESPAVLHREYHGR